MTLSDITHLTLKPLVKKRVIRIWPIPEKVLKALQEDDVSELCKKGKHLSIKIVKIVKID